MKFFERSIEPFVIAHESAEASGPGEASFDHPPSEAQRSRLRLETAKGCHELFDLASRQGSAGFHVALNA
jgi:hypothetical protein